MVSNSVVEKASVGIQGLFVFYALDFPFIFCISKRHALKKIKTKEVCNAIFTINNDVFAYGGGEC